MVNGGQHIQVLHTSVALSGASVYPTGPHALGAEARASVGLRDVHMRPPASSRPGGRQPLDTRSPFAAWPGCVHNVPFQAVKQAREQCSSPPLCAQGTTLGRQSRPQQRVSVPAAIAESAGAVSAFSERPCPTSAWDECPATRPGPTQRQPGVPTSSGPPGGGAADASAAVTVPCRADGRGPLDAQSFFWFGRPRLMLRVFRCS